MTASLDGTPVKTPDSNVWHMAQHQLDEVSKLINLSDSIHGYLARAQTRSRSLGSRPHGCRSIQDVHRLPRAAQHVARARRRAVFVFIRM